MTILLAEKAPPGKKAEAWIKANKSRFKDKYGDKAGEKILYGKAWNLFGEEELNEISAEKAKSAKASAYLKRMDAEHEASEKSPLKGHSQKDQSDAWEKVKRLKAKEKKFGDYADKKTVSEDVAANAMGDSASNPDTGNIKGFSPRLFKSPKLLKRHERLLKRLLQNLPKK